MKFKRKGYGRIFVHKESDIEIVENIIKEIDEDEFEYYYPISDGERLVTVFSESNYNTIYVGKFDEIDISEVLRIAWEKGIHCFAIIGE